MRGFIKSVEVGTSYITGRGSSVIDLNVEIVGSNWALQVDHVPIAEWVVPGFEVRVIKHDDGRLNLKRVEGEA